MKILFLAWQDPKSRAWFPIGRLTFDGTNYKFVYTYGAVEAQQQCEFPLVYSFPELNKVYTSSELFPLFSNRLMRRSRPDYKNYITWLNIPEGEDNPITILARSGGQKATDHFEVFSYPEPDRNGLYHIHFFAHGLQRLPIDALERINRLHVGELLYLANEFQNPHNSQALLLCTGDRHIVGYCPRYLTRDALENLQLVYVSVERINPAPTPLQLRLLCNMTARWYEDFHPFSSPEYQPVMADTPVAVATP